MSTTSFESNPSTAQLAEAPAAGTFAVWLIRALATVGLGLSVYLAVLGATETPAAGCTGQQSAVDCDSVLTSRWSRWLNVPVGFGAVAVYASALAASLFLGRWAPVEVVRLSWGLLLALATIAAGAAVWFTALQLWAIESVCVYCLATHLSGAALATVAWIAAPIRVRSTPRAGATGRLGPLAAVWAATIGLLGVAVLVGGQLIIEPPAPRAEAFEAPAGDIDPGGARVKSLEALDEPDVADGQPPVEKSRIVSLSYGVKTLDAYRHPIVGSPEADVIVVKMFDYTCKHCHRLDKLLREARRRYGDRLAVLMVPVPMHRGCNKYAGDSAAHQYACVLARMAVAVFRADRTKFVEFNDYLFSKYPAPAPDEARAFARRLVGARKFDKAYADAATLTAISDYVKTYGAIGRGSIPKLVDNKHKVDAKIKTEQQLYDLLEETFGVPPPQAGESGR